MQTSAVSSGATTQLQNTKSQLKSEDFIKIMLTELQHQDPLDPAKSQDLLAQMSQISQLQSSTDMQTMLKGLTLQNQIGSAGQLIGKMVAGTDDNSKAVTGQVTSVRVQDSQVYLELDNGNTLRMDKVTTIAPATATTSGSGTTATGS